MAAKKSAKTTKAKKAAVSRDMTELIDLTPEAAKALVRPRDGFEEHAEPLFELWANHEETLGSLAIGVEEARERLARYRDLASEEVTARAAVDAANKRLEMVQETRALQASKVWSVMLDIYGKGKQAGKSDAKIAAEIKAFVSFMATGPRKKNGEG